MGTKQRYEKREVSGLWLTGTAGSRDCVSSDSSLPGKADCRRAGRHRRDKRHYHLQWASRSQLRELTAEPLAWRPAKESSRIIRRLPIHTHLRLRPSVSLAHCVDTSQLTHQV